MLLRRVDKLNGALRFCNYETILSSHSLRESRACSQYIRSCLVNAISMPDTETTENNFFVSDGEIDHTFCQLVVRVALQLHTILLIWLRPVIIIIYIPASHILYTTCLCWTCCNFFRMTRESFFRGQGNQPFKHGLFWWMVNERIRRWICKIRIGR